ncbi:MULTISPECIES: hypothetical protein [unclassified Streptomyces]|uniref:hypothetical protein n=1 Tax=unclassified Streptomyces TaxID=2593676 RepID=UPI0032446C10
MDRQSTIRRSPRSKAALALALLGLASALTMVVPTTPAQAAGCGVSGGTLWCGNREVAMHFGPGYNSEVGDWLTSTYSWFSCWTYGGNHEGGNNTWYGTQGDAVGMFGYVPAVALNTSSQFDANPGNYGLPHC